MTHDPNEPQVLVKVPSDLEANMIRSALAAQEINATLTGEFTAGFRAEAPGQVSVVVRRADLERAQAELKNLMADQGDVDWSTVDCGDKE